MGEDIKKRNKCGKISPKTDLKKNKNTRNGLLNDCKKV